MPTAAHRWLRARRAWPTSSPSSRTARRYRTPRWPGCGSASCTGWTDSLTKEKIQSLLREIEEREGIKIVYACESGSRAWGFPSPDSDYDVRFIYLRPRDWYLSIDLERKRDVIEIPPSVDTPLDISGWDLRKTLNLLHKSNPPLLEWLSSPIVYVEDHNFVSRMRELAPRFFSSTACSYHYLRVAQRKYTTPSQSSELSLKDYLYALRAVLAIKWIEQGFGVVPMAFSTLVDHTVDTPELRNAIQKLVAAKRETREMDRRPNIVLISDFVETELARLEGVRFEHQSVSGTIDELNEFFRASCGGWRENWEQC